MPKIAQAIYDGRLFDRMGELADALEAAGCDNEDILMHCRGRERCGFCCGKGKMLSVQSVRGKPEGGLEIEGGIEAPCMVCNGTGWRPLGCGHARGCWVLDLLMGKT